MDAITQRCRSPALPVLVFTDLDGTLLDHDSYSFAPASPALARLRELCIPLIAATSKTLAEVAAINSAMDNPHPCVIENGGAVCVPVGYFRTSVSDVVSRGFEVVRSGPDYDWVTGQLARLRREQGYRFAGFADMDDDTVARLTNLPRSAAHNARQRLATEPLVWQDRPEALHGFGEELRRLNMRLLRGGRFWHVQGSGDKRTAMDWLVGVYRDEGLPSPVTVALGDSPNDLDMLRGADVPVVIRRKDGSHMDGLEGLGARLSAQPGPAGWNATVLQILLELEERRIGA